MLLWWERLLLYTTRPCGRETFLIPSYGCHPIWQVISPNHILVSSWPRLILSAGSQLRWISTRHLQVVADRSSYLISRKGIGDFVLISSQCSIITIPFWFSFFLPELTKIWKIRMTENWAQIKEIWKYYVTKEDWIVNSIYSYHWSVHNTSTTQLSYCTTQPSSIVPQILGFMSVRVHVYSPRKSKYESKLASRRDEVGCGTHQRRALASQTWERSWNLKKSGVSVM